MEPMRPMGDEKPCSVPKKMMSGGWITDKVRLEVYDPVVDAKRVRPIDLV